MFVFFDCEVNNNGRHLKNQNNYLDKIYSFHKMSYFKLYLKLKYSEEYSVMVNSNIVEPVQYYH